VTKIPSDVDRAANRLVAHKSAKAILKTLSTKLHSAEAELLETVRGKDAPEFALSIECHDGHWAVRHVTSGTVHSALEGFGDTFGKAWQSRTPASAADEIGPARARSK
jgi:hypothetical protein